MNCISIVMALVSLKCVQSLNLSKLDHTDSHSVTAPPDSGEDQVISEKSSGHDEEMAFNMMKNGQYSEGIDHLNRALKLEPNSARLYCQRSAAYHSFGRIEDALKDSEQCIKLDKNSANGYVRKGYALVALNRLKEAEESFLKAHHMDKNNLDIMRDYLAARIIAEKLASIPNPVARLLTAKYSAIGSLMSRLYHSGQQLATRMAPAVPSARQVAEIIKLFVVMKAMLMPLGMAIIMDTMMKPGVVWHL